MLFGRVKSLCTRPHANVTRKTKERLDLTRRFFTYMLVVHFLMMVFVLLVGVGMVHLLMLFHFCSTSCHAVKGVSQFRDVARS
jgi:hypothetical protein